MPESNIGAAFDDGAADFERLAPSLWNPMGNALVAAAEIEVGDTILDAGCGTGATTIPAAQYAGPGGRVDGVDLSAQMLALAQAKASTLSLENVVLHVDDISGWSGDEPFDVVLSAYSIFFLPDMDKGAAHLISNLRSGGRLALSTWADGALKHFTELLVQECRRERPELTGLFSGARDNTERLNTPEKLTAWLEGLGLQDIKVLSTPAQVQLSPSLAWSLVMGSGLRFLLPGDPEAADRVKAAFLAQLGEEHNLNADTLIASARRP
ncbi:methyltransferase domain-containing protein [Arthrobacter gengyunqii]|uniref:Methyltransferase domain-containing protein n=1 Tax=Arthrobacter gengyunqii TaxID=2886940 RepID=A0A9X1LYD1_9MICC|nr:class I SAM-dependent methyltransferase [Arthrobacter gengyunqii]MCC3267983.1 methyltransferase domain-containing protein [Arthrobacter gengyunqii]UOY95404.1 methyltransferase domain-containing protein [Arthrobacter gengyunqii]